MKRTTVLIILDAARDDYLDQRSMPFLDTLGRDNYVGSVDSPPGFAQRTVLFTGRYPDTSNNFSAFAFDPENSPFDWVTKLGPARALVKPRKILYPTRWGIAAVTRALRGTYHPDPAWIPPRYLPFFRPCEDMQPVFEPGALGAPSVFDLMRDEGRTFRYLAHPVSGDDDEVHKLLIREIRDQDRAEFIVAQFSVTDQQGHVHGPHSSIMRDGFLPELDGRLASIHAALEAAEAPYDLVIVGDHGMAPVERHVDLVSAIESVDAKPGKDYVLFVNSTLGVLWYLTEKGRGAIEAALPEIPGTYLIDTDERRRQRIPTDRCWGDRMIAAEPGVLFWPDYFHVKDSEILGMHGYLDKSTETHGMLVMVSSDGRIPRGRWPKAKLVDIFPTVCDLVGLPMPVTQEGTSLIALEHDVIHAR